jgi:hypothetical protein
MDLRVKLEAADNRNTAMMKMGDRLIAEREVAAKAAKAEYERGFDDGFILRKEKDEGANKDTGYEYTDGYEDGYKAGMEEKKPWVGLTDEEFHDLQIEHGDDLWANFKAIEAKSKEKNT